jgi:argininosuccinate synthase
MNRIILSYDGSPESHAAIGRLAARQGSEVVTVTTDHGQPLDFEPVRDRALAAGAARAHVLDVRERFAAAHVLPALQAGVLHDTPELALALAAPLVASVLVEVAGMEGARHVACVRGTDGQAVAAALATLAPALQVEVVDVPPAEPSSRDTAEAACSATGNVWVRQVAVPAGTPWDDVPAAAYAWTEAPTTVPDVPAVLDLDFARGVPVAVNGVHVPLLELIEIVTTIAGDHGIGRQQRGELARAGRRLVLESPAGAVLGAAHAALEAAVTDADLRAVKRACGLAYRDLVVAGRWCSPAREAVDALVARAQADVSGTVRLSLGRGRCHVTGVAPHVHTHGSAARPGAPGTAVARQSS